MTKTVEEHLRELPGMTTEQLVERYTALKGRPPRRKYARWLRKRIAWLIQERAFGGLSQAAKRRIAELQRELNIDLDGPARGEQAARGTALRPGTSLEREWHGRLIRVAVLGPSSFECDGERYTSLSAVATAVTGTRWNGRLFFGLKKARKHA